MAAGGEPRLHVLTPVAPGRRRWRRQQDEIAKGLAVDAETARAFGLR
jgi:hypothetical protein